MAVFARLSHSPGFNWEVGGRDHRSLCAALVTRARVSALERIDWRPFEPPTHSDSGGPEADQRRQADACHTPGWFDMACSYAGGTGGLPPRPGRLGLTQRPAGTSRERHTRGKFLQNHPGAPPLQRAAYSLIDLVRTVCLCRRGVRTPAKASGCLKLSEAKWGKKA
jgi:hypothetical protein